MLCLLCSLVLSASKKPLDADAAPLSDFGAYFRGGEVAEPAGQRIVQGRA
jgi:hypothetical protein